jgi:hypothetical protein
MSEYQLELKQVVDYPRCRIYRQFIQTLIADRSIRVSEYSGLFYFVVLCSYANFRTSYRRMDGISYTIYPGEWLCTLDELSKYFRARFHYQAKNILDDLQRRHLITYVDLGHGKLVKFKITGWRKHNTILDYNAPCQKDTGFFFFPMSIAAELVSAGKCSEMDAVLDLWLNTVYNDEQVQGSEVGPVVYLRNGTGCPLVSYADLAARWGVSKTTAGRYLKKLSELGYLSISSFPGTHGSVIYLQNYLSTMFQISDVMIDKEEVAMALNIKISLPDEADDNASPNICKNPSSVSTPIPIVSKSHIRLIEEKVRKILTTQGIPCFECPKSRYMLLPLSDDCKGEMIMKDAVSLLPENRFYFTISCGGSQEVFRFELTLIPIKSQHEQEV